MDNLKELYPEYANKSSVKLQRYSIVPLGVKSKHKGKSVTVSKDSKESLVSKIKNTPLYTVEGEYLPNDHGTGTNKKKVIGNAIGAGTYTDELGIEWVYADYMMFNDANEAEIDLIESDIESVSCSMEAKPMYQGSNILDFSEYVGTSILKKGQAAWDTELLVADKGEDSVPIIVTLDDALKQILEGTFTTQLNAKDQRVSELESDLTGKDDALLELQSKYDALLEVNQNLKDYIS